MVVYFSVSGKSNNSLLASACQLVQSWICSPSIQYEPLQCFGVRHVATAQPDHICSLWRSFGQKTHDKNGAICQHVVALQALEDKLHLSLNDII